MTTVAQLRKAALGLAETEEGTHFGMVSFEVAGKGFASVTQEGVVQLYMSDPDSEDAIQRYSGVDRLIRMGKPIGIRVPLDDINGMHLNILVHKSWESRAPKRLMHETSDAAQGDLPDNLGAPANRALSGAGITSLAQAAEMGRKELLAMHGVGPKAVERLFEAMAEKGLGFKE
ncbi:MAG: hypothetical protein GEU79_09510 [Acidimicrobiia bacterium]|nr:hypothetical protein [Acidimicrobiia bacterium]